jgi:hypothetical protein
MSLKPFLYHSRRYVDWKIAWSTCPYQGLGRLASQKCRWLSTTK